MTMVFISYKRIQPDQQLAQRLAESLRQSGHHVFIDTEIPPGVDWSKEIDIKAEVQAKARQLIEDLDTKAYAS